MAHKNSIAFILLGSALSVGVVSDAAPPRFDNTSFMPKLMLDQSTQLSVAQNSTKPKDTGRRARTRPLVTAPIVFNSKSIRRATNMTASRISVAAKQSPSILTQAQQDNLKLLASSANGSSAEIRFDWNNGTPSFIKISGKSLRPSRTLNLAHPTAQQIGAAFLNENSKLLKLDSAAQELRLLDERSEPSGKKHLRYQQQFQGLDVWGQQLSLHLDKDGIYLVNGRYTPTPTIATTPNVTPEDATRAAKKDFAPIDASTSLPQLLLYSDQDRVLLAYKLELTAGINERWIYFVDAQTSKIVNKINAIHTAGELVAASGQDLQQQNENFNAWRENGTYYLIDPSIPSPDIGNPIALNAKGDTLILDAGSKNQGPLNFVTNTSASSNWDPVAVSAMRNTLAVYLYFLNNFQRKSLDNQNMNLMVIIHVGSNFNNAGWNGTQMLYGDGDGQKYLPLAKCLDVAAHEMTHGVMQHEANLVYQYQSGALNESFSDVFAAMVDRGNWTIGESCTLAAPGFLRSLQDPSLGLYPQPTHMKQYRNIIEDNGGVHVNSGIPNRAAYLLAEGLTAENSGTSIGRDKTEKIYYRALTTYLTASAQFIDARRALIQSAQDLFPGSADANAVAAAWDAVGVTEGGIATPDNRTSSPSDAVPGDDLMIYLSPRDGTRDENVNDIYDVYVQTMDKPFVGYNKNKDQGPRNVMSAATTPPAGITDSTGTSVFFVGSDGNIYFIDPAGRNEQITSSGDIWSIAVAPDGRYFAYTTANPNDKTIHVINTDTAKVTDFPIQPPNYQEGNVKSINTILYAESLSFDYTGTHLVFDALNCLSVPNNSCDQVDGGYRYWSIGLIDINQATVSHPIPNQNPDFDLGYPRFAANNNFVIAFDVQDYTDFATTHDVRSGVVSVNFEKQKVSSVIDFGVRQKAFWGIPSFWGNDDFVTVQTPVNTSSIIAAARVPLVSDWAGDAAKAEEINPFAVAFPQMHRAGIRQVSGALSTSATLLDFANISVGASRDLAVVIKNTGNRDVNISNISVDGSAFSHNATNTFLPRGASMPITVSFRPAATGTQVANLTISSDGEPRSLNVSLTGIANSADSAQPGPASPTPSAGSGGRGGGGSDYLSTFMLFAYAITIFRYRQGKKKLSKI